MLKQIDQDILALLIQKMVETRAEEVNECLLFLKFIRIPWSIEPDFEEVAHHDY